MCLVLAGGAIAQPVDAFLHVGNWIPSGAPVIRFDATGKTQTTLGVLPANFSVLRFMLAEDNAACRAIGYFNTRPNYRGAVIDVSPKGAVSTFAVSSQMISPEQMMRTCDGEWLLLGRRANVTSLEIFKVAGGGMTRVGAVGAMWTYGVVEDFDSGLWVVRCVTQMPAYAEGYYYLDPWTGVNVGMVVHGANSPVRVLHGAKRLVTDPVGGAFYDMHHEYLSRKCAAVRILPGVGVTTLTRTVQRYPCDMVAPGGRTSGFGFYLFLNRSWPPIMPTEIQRVTKKGVSVGTSILNGPVLHAWTGVVREGSRHLTWFMDTPPNGRRLQLSFPNEAGRGYAVGFSLRGVRPGVVLKDARVIPLVPDDLTVLGLTGGVPGVLEDAVGQLDTAGKAQVKVNTNAFGTRLKGVRIWATALVLDPKARLGIAQIVGPTVLNIRR
jgi:hypothetical protein